MTDLPAQMGAVFTLLKKVQPLPEEYDVVWAGPYYIPRRRQWFASRFMLYRGTLYATLVIPPAHPAGIRSPNSARSPSNRKSG